jgi:hypothetical protein
LCGGDENNRPATGVDVRSRSTQAIRNRLGTAWRQFVPLTLINIVIASNPAGDLVYIDPTAPATGQFFTS